MALVTGIIDLTDIIERITVPNNNKARLMYYLDWVCSVLKLDDSTEINRFVKHVQEGKSDHAFCCKNVLCCNIFAICIYRSVTMSIDCQWQFTFRTGNLRQIFSYNFFFWQNIFLPTNLFLRLNFISDWLFSRTRFCLGLHVAAVFRMQSFNVMFIIHVCFSVQNIFAAQNMIRFSYPPPSCV